VCAAILVLAAVATAPAPNVVVTALPAAAQSGGQTVQRQDHVGLSMSMAVPGILDASAVASSWAMARPPQVAGSRKSRLDEQAFPVGYETPNMRVVWT
jgi:hypothetical protein